MERDALRVLRENQREILDFLPEDEGCALALHNMRTGKTLPTAQWVMGQLERGKKVLVICPPNVVPVWEKELAGVGDGHNSRELLILKDSMLRDDDICPKTKKIRKRKTELLYKNHWDVVVVDEIHRYRHYKARLRKLRWISKKSSIRVGLTGTPFDTCVAEMFYYLQWLTWDSFFGGKISHKVFYATFCYPIDPNSKFSKMEIRDDIIGGILNEMKEFTTFYKTDSVVEPDHVMIKYRLTKEQLELMESVMYADYNPLFGEGQEEWSAAHRKDKARQIAGGFFIDAFEEVHELCSTRKWAVFTSWLRNMRGQQVVVWYRYIEERKILEEMLGEYYSIRKFSKRNLIDFRNREFDIMLCHPRSAGAGVDISCADVSIFITPNPAWIDNIQSYYRLSRYQGEEKKVIYHMTSDHVIDTDAFEKLGEKRQTTEWIYREGMKDAV